MPCAQDKMLNWSMLLKIHSKMGHQYKLMNQLNKRTCSDTYQEEHRRDVLSYMCSCLAHSDMAQ